MPPPSSPNLTIVNGTRKWKKPSGILTLYSPKSKTAEFQNGVDLNEKAHNEPPHLDLHCLPSSL